MAIDCGPGGPMVQDATMDQEGGSGPERSEQFAGRWASSLAGALRRAVLFLLSLFLFVVSLELIKGSATGSARLISTYLNVDSALNALGFGWLASYVVMSGSPVAAVSVAFLAAGALDQLSAYAMLVGSRLGASFIVLLIGFVYVLRGRERRSGLAMGLLALVVTASVYLPALLVGGFLLSGQVLSSAQLGRGAVLGSAVERVLSPVVQPLFALLPGWGVALLGLALLWVCFYLFDRVLPELNLENSRFSEVARLVYRPLPMLILGSLITLLTLSVSLSLSLLVPLSARGYIRRENAIPYIMGANITTLADTLLATVVLGSSDAFSVVLATIVSVTLVSLVVLLLFYRRYERGVLALVEWAVTSNRNLALLVSVILLLPLVLLFI